MQLDEPGDVRYVPPGHAVVEVESKEMKAEQQMEAEIEENNDE